jgi:threonine dehydrogenase-like Zn-dependent dehydrogenase
MRYGNVFDEAIRLVQSRRIKVEQLISDVVPLTHIADAMAKAAGKGSSLKVQLAIDA